MKRSFYAVGLLILMVTSQASAQNSEQSFIAKSDVMNIPFEKMKSPAVSAIALDRFGKAYRDAKDVEWTEIPNGYRAYFLQDAVLTVVDYTRKGKLASVIRYGEDLLSPYIKLKLEENFDVLQIRDVAEVKMAGFTTKVFVVVMEDQTSVKTVQVIDDDITVVHEMLK